MVGLDSAYAIFVACVWRCVCLGELVAMWLACQFADLFSEAGDLGAVTLVAVFSTYGTLVSNEQMIHGYPQDVST